METFITFSQHVQNALKVKGMTAEQLADEIHFIPGHIIALVAGKVYPGPRMLPKICKALGLDEKEMKLAVSMEKEAMQDAKEKKDFAMRHFVLKEAGGGYEPNDADKPDIVH